MKNKFYYILTLFLVSFSFINVVFAEEGKYNLELNLVTDSSEIVEGSETSVKVSLKSDSAIAYCLVKVDSDEKIEFVGRTGINGWNVDSDGSGVNGIIVKNDTNNKDFTTGLNILELRYKINGSGNLKLSSSSYCINDKDEEVSVSEKSISISAKNKEQVTTLKTIKVNGEELENFSSNRFDNYAYESSSSTLNIEYETTNPEFQNDVVLTDLFDNPYPSMSNIPYNDGNQGVMVFKLVVKNTTTYVFAVAYSNASLDNTLKSLKVNGQKIELQPGKFDGYSITVPSNTASVRVEAVLNDSNNFKIVNNENGIWDASVQGQSSYIAVNIKPVDPQSGGSSVTYGVEVIREGSSSSSSSSSSNEVPIVKPSGSQGNVEKNPPTGNISMFVMSLILISSLFGSLFLYQKNIEKYK